MQFRGHREKCRSADRRTLKVEAVTAETNVNSILLASTLEWSWWFASFASDANASDNAKETDDYRFVRNAIKLIQLSICVKKIQLYQFL